MEKDGNFFVLKIKKKTWKITVYPYNSLLSAYVDNNCNLLPRHDKIQIATRVLQYNIIQRK